MHNRFDHSIDSLRYRRKDSGAILISRTFCETPFPLPRYGRYIVGHCRWSSTDERDASKMRSTTTSVKLHVITGSRVGVKYCFVSVKQLHLSFTTVSGHLAVAP